MNLIKTLFEELVSLKGVNAAFCLNRPFSQHPPSLHAFYDCRDKSNVTWYFRGQTSANRQAPAIGYPLGCFLNTGNRGRVCLFSQNEIEAIYGRSLVHVKVEPRSTLLRQLLEEVYLR